MIKMMCLFFMINLSAWASNFTDVREKAQIQNKVILIELVMESCSYCEKMDKFVLSKEDVRSLIDKNYIFVKLDIHKDEIPEFLTSRITPTFYFLTADNIVLHEIIGASSKSEFIALLERFGVKR